MRRRRTARFALLTALIAVGCAPAAPAEGPPITTVHLDDFERAELGAEWTSTAADAYRIVDGALSGHGAYNHPLWLRRKLPRDAVVELDVWSRSSDGDLKIELYGDGRSSARDRGQYTSSGYVAIMGGWSNSISVLVAGDEHRPDRPQRRGPRVEIDKRYHWRLVKKGGRLDWYVDDMATPFLSYEGAPLDGPGHEYLAISNWASDAWFDNLRITPL